jgi:hypothetical protein
MKSVSDEGEGGERTNIQKRVRMSSRRKTTITTTTQRERGRGREREREIDISLCSSPGWVWTARMRSSWDTIMGQAARK